MTNATNSAALTVMHTGCQTVAEWIAERRAVKARAAARAAKYAADWAHINALIALAAAEDAAR